MIKLITAQDPNPHDAAIDAEERLAKWIKANPRATIADIKTTAYAATETGGDYPEVWHHVILTVTYVEHDPTPAKTCADFEQQQAIDPALTELARIARNLSGYILTSEDHDFAMAVDKLAGAVIDYVATATGLPPVPTDTGVDDDLDAAEYEARAQLGDACYSSGE